MQSIRPIATTIPTQAGMLAGRAIGGGGFTLPGAAGGAQAVISAGAVAMGGLLALQEAGGEAVQDRAARRRGRDVLAELTQLQRALLGGGVSSEHLSRLAGLLEAMPVASDPALRASLAAIALRAQVELARYTPL